MSETKLGNMLKMPNNLATYHMQELIQIWKTNVARYDCHPIAQKREESNLRQILNKRHNDLL